MLKGIKVLDFSQYIPGSFTSMRLENMGAEVIKVEPLTGDVVRKFGKQKNAEGVIFSAYNRNKKSIGLNLKDQAGYELAIELIKKVDVVIESYRPGVMERFGLDYNRMKKWKEDMIYISLTGYGQRGTMVDFGSHDLNYQALSGVLSQLTDEEGRPVLPKITFADVIGGLSASEKIVSALFKRERTGKGTYIDLSLMDEVLSLTNLKIFTEAQKGLDNVITQLDGELISYNIYETKDRRYVVLAALEPKFWETFCRTFNREDWIPAHMTTKGPENPTYQELKNLFLSKTFSEWYKLSMELDSCLTPILKIEEIKEHPYIIEKELLSFRGTAPKLGQHTEDLLKNVLHKDVDEIKELQNKGVVK